MAVPNAPVEGAGSKILFLVYDATGTNTAALMRAYHEGTLNAENVADLGVYPTSGTLENGGQTLAGTAAEALAAASIPCQGCIVKAASSNVGTIYVGKSDVTTDFADSTGGYPLEPGESVGVPCRDVTEVYIRGTSGDKVAWIASAD